MLIEDYAERVEMDEARDSDMAIYGNNTAVGKCAYCGMPLFVQNGCGYLCQNCGTTTGCS